jgi:hypothetical protein
MKDLLTEILTEPLSSKLLEVAAEIQELDAPMEPVVKSTEVCFLCQKVLTSTCIYSTVM